MNDYSVRPERVREIANTVASLEGLVVVVALGWLEEVQNRMETLALLVRLDSGRRLWPRVETGLGLFEAIVLFEVVRYASKGAARMWRRIFIGRG